MTDVSVIIPAFNAEATVGRTLKGLSEQDAGFPFEVIVVDDGSSDQTIPVVERSAVDATVLWQNREGAAAARNRGAREARGAILAFLDSDCVPSPGWLTAGVGAIKDADLVQGKVLPDPASRPHPLDRSLWVEGETFLYQSANLFVRTELFDRLGGFEHLVGPVTGRPLGEDVWLGWRARRAGAATAYSDAALVRHTVFRRGLAGFLAERLRLAHFPAIAAKIPELRHRFFFARWFLSVRSAALDLGLVGVVTALLVGSAIPLLAVAPYAAILAWNARGWRRYAPLSALSGLLADLVGFGALTWGSAKARTLVI